jgi:DNA-binding NarL/FixJ family response regulator
LQFPNILITNSENVRDWVRGDEMSDRRTWILIIDGDASFRLSVARLLARAGLSAAEAVCGEEGLEAGAAERPAAVILEVSLPDIDGLEVCRELRDRYGDDLPVLLVAALRVAPHDRIAGLLVGGDEYLVKPVDGDELLVRVRRLLARSERSGSPVSRDRRNALTVREFEVLRLLAQGVDAAGISDLLVISPKTVSSHLQRVMAKLGVRTRAQAVAEAYRLGLVRTSDSESHALVARTDFLDRAPRQAVA